MSSPSNQQGRGVGKSDAGAKGAFENMGRQKRIPTASIKPKDLCLIPFRLAIAAQKDGWWVRSVIIWNKPNPMPESVRDRPTESHEYILMLTKNKKYYWDQDAVREEYSPTVRWGGDKYKGAIKKGKHGEDAGLDRERSCFPNTGRNIRSVWEFPTTPFPAAHFAVFPEKLPEICIKAATPEVGCCSNCGTPWERIVERPDMRERPLRAVAKQDGQRIHSGFDGYPQSAGQEWQKWRDENPDKTLAWQPTCKCEGATPLPSLVLDPFAGAGTTLLVAKRLNRRAVGYEISEEYCELTVNRCQQQVLV